MKVGIIAGEGELPVHVLAGAREAGFDAIVAQIEGFGAPERFSTLTTVAPIARLGALTKWLRRHKVTHVTFAGRVARPDFTDLKPDLKGMRHLPALAAAARKGDDALLQAVLAIFESEGFTVLPPQDLAANILATEGQLGAHAARAHRDDILRAFEIARGIGALDIGQGAVVADGITLAVEAQEGTSDMLRRVSKLPAAIRGVPGARRGVLAKLLKPGQDARVDLPTIGPETIELAARAGLAGIAVEAGRAFVIDRDTCVERADATGLFLIGLPPA